MKIFTAEQVRKIDAYTIEHEPISSVNLMERAARKCFDWIVTHVSPALKTKVLVGPGNNGGDGLAIARMLSQQGWMVEVYLIDSPERMSPDALENYKRFSDMPGTRMTLVETPQIEIRQSDLVIDAMFGSGLTRALDGIAAEISEVVNQSSALVISIDSPSGLNYETNSNQETHSIICATHTLSFQFPKLSFFFSENARYVGKWHLLNIHLHEDSINQIPSSNFYLTPTLIAPILKKRTYFSHKGTFGHALLIAGSFGMAGAAILAARSCLKTGVGLITVHIKETCVPILQTAIPEAIVSYTSVLPEMNKYNAVGIGPGIGIKEDTSKKVYKLIKSVSTPLVIDADGLNILANNKDWLSLLPPNSILTPHPGEFDRLFGPSFSSYERHGKQMKMAHKYQIIIILKGANTSIALPNQTCYFNSTGNPGMATAGSGDVLTGIVLSLLAQGYEPTQAAIVAPFLHGLAGDLATEEIGEESLIASDIINYLNKAFAKLRATTP